MKTTYESNGSIFYCASEALDEALFLRFNTVDACVKITDAAKFFEKIGEFLVQRFNKEIVLLHRPIIYTARENLLKFNAGVTSGTTTDVIIREREQTLDIGAGMPPPAFIKDREYRIEREYRALWEIGPKALETFSCEEDLIVEIPELTQHCTVIMKDETWT